MRFDVLGRIVEARVTSVREVQWEDARSGGFMFVFRPGPLAHALQTWIGILQGPEDAAARGRLVRDLVAKFPNVSAIDLVEVLTTLQNAVANITLAISIVGAIALLSGVLILAGAVAMTKFQRVYEAAILRTLGASTRMLGAMLALEYGALGLLAGCGGASGAVALTWAVSRHVLGHSVAPRAGLPPGRRIVTTLVGDRRCHEATCCARSRWGRFAPSEKAAAFRCYRAYGDSRDYRCGAAGAEVLPGASPLGASARRHSSTSTRSTRSTSSTAPVVPKAPVGPVAPYSAIIMI